MSLAVRKETWVDMESTSSAQISRDVSEIAKKLASHWELKEEMLAKGEELAEIMKVIVERQIVLSQDTISLTRTNLQKMEDCLDGKVFSYVLNSEQNIRLQNIFLDISQALFQILIIGAAKSLCHK